MAGKSEIPVSGMAPTPGYWCQSLQWYLVDEAANVPGELSDPQWLQGT